METCENTITVPSGETAESVLRAYAVGYHDGYVHGYVPGDESPYNDTPLGKFYDQGFNAGIGEFREQTWGMF